MQGHRPRFVGAARQPASVSEGSGTMPNTDKKQRREAKRKAKRLAIRRRESVSPIKRLVEARGELECWASDNLDDMGQVQLFVYKQGAGLTGLAAFLVDRGVVGLKDAWVQMDVDRQRIREMLDESATRGIDMCRVAVEDIRRWVAGGVRWAHENGMRLPKDWSKPASFIGGVGDWSTADVSQFTKEFAGHPEDLRQRLIREPLDTYLRRSDIQFTFSTNAPYLDQRSGQYRGGSGGRGVLAPLDDEEIDDEDLDAIAADMPVEEMEQVSLRFQAIADSLAAQTALWLKERNEQPSPAIPDAWLSIITAGLTCKAAMPDAGPKEFADMGNEMLAELAEQIDKDRLPEYERAFGQVTAHFKANRGVLMEAFATESDDEEPGE